MVGTRSPPPHRPCGVVWCGSGLGLLGPGCFMTVVIMIMNVIMIMMIIIILFLFLPSTSFNCHRPQACQERDARDRWIVNALMSESRLEVSTVTRTTRIRCVWDEILVTVLELPCGRSAHITTRASWRGRAFWSLPRKVRTGSCSRGGRTGTKLRSSRPKPFQAGGGMITRRIDGGKP